MKFRIVMDSAGELTDDLKGKEEYITVPFTIRLGEEEIIDDVLFCYEKVDSVHYMVWFGTTLGEGVYFYSDTKKWEDRLRKVGE